MKDGQVIHAKTPCMLPDLSSACMVRLHDCELDKFYPSYINISSTLQIKNKKVPSLVLKERDDVLRSSNVNLYQLRMSEFKHKLSFEINN